MQLKQNLLTEQLIHIAIKPSISHFEYLKYYT